MLYEEPLLRLIILHVDDDSVNEIINFPAGVDYKLPGVGVWGMDVKPSPVEQENKNKKKSTH